MSSIKSKSKEMNFVSIIISSYNYGWLLPETLDSVLAQTYQDWECIVIDDGSTDKTREIMQAYLSRDKRFRYVYQKNGGMSSGRNHGLRLAKGDFIHFLDADDLLVPEKISVQVEYLVSTPEVDIVYGDVRYFLHGSQAVLSHSMDMKNEPWMRVLEGKGLNVIHDLVEHNQIVMCAPLIRVELLRRVGFFLESLRSLEDWEFWLRCAFQGACFHHQAGDNTLSLVRVHPTSTSQNHSRMQEYTRKVRELIVDPLQKLGSKSALALNETWLGDVIVGQALEQFRQGNHRAGLLHFWHLARRTGRYDYYLRSAIYWLRQPLN